MKKAPKTKDDRIKKIVNNSIKSTNPSKTKSGFYLAELALLIRKPDQKMLEALVEAGEMIDVDMNAIRRALETLSKKKDFSKLMPQQKKWLEVVDILIEEEKEHLKKVEFD